MLKLNKCLHQNEFYLEGFKIIISLLGPETLYNMFRRYSLVNYRKRRKKFLKLIILNGVNPA